MGLLKSLPLRLPRLSSPSYTIYRLIVQAGDRDPHVLALLDEGGDEPVVLSNAHLFKMPDPAIFERVDYLGTEFRGVPTPVIEAEARETADGFEPVDLPDGLAGKWVPEVDRTEEELQQLA